MLMNIMLYFVFPWVIVIFFLKINFKIILLLSPFSSVVANLLNTWTIAYDFAEVSPFPVETNYASLPMIVGIIPALSSVMIQLISKYGSFFILIILFSIGTTLLEGTGLFFGFIKYYNDWNIGWTFLEYFIGFASVYGYYQLLKKREIL